MKRTDFLALVATSALLAPVTLPAQDSRVFVTSTDNEFVVVDFDTGTTQPAGQANGSNFQGLAVRGTGQQLRVLVSSSSQGGQLLIFDPDSSPAGAVVAQGFEGGLGGLTVDGAGNAFALSEGGGSTAVWAILRDPACDPSAMTAVGSCRPGGYAAPVKIAASLPGAQRLADIKVVPYSGAGLVAGDLLIAAARPGRLYCLPNPIADGNADHCASGVYSDALAGFEPTGLAFAPSGAVLVSVWEGDVRVLSPANAASSNSFVGGTPGNATGVSVGRSGEAFRVFVATHNGGAVHRYDLEGQPLGSVSAGFQSPNGLGSLIATLGAATPVGANQTVRSTADEITFDVVTGAGVTTMQAFVFEDPRPGVDANLSQPLADSLVLADVDGLPDDVPTDLVIPAHFRPRSDAAGRKIIVLFRGETTAAFAGTVNHHVFEHFGAEADCSVPESWLQPRLLWARDTGGVMEDITSGCGSDVGRAWRFSWFALVHDTRSLEDAFDQKLTALDDASTCLGRGGRSQRKAISSAQRDARRGSYCDAQAQMQGLADDLDATASSCEAELEARALSAGYTASLLCN